YRSGQSEGAIVRLVNRLLIGIEFTDHDDRAEYLLAPNIHLGCHIGDDRGGVEPSACHVFGGRSSERDRRTLLPCTLNRLSDAISLSFGSQRPKLGGGVGRVAHSQRGSPVN